MLYGVGSTLLWRYFRLNVFQEPTWVKTPVYMAHFSDTRAMSKISWEIYFLSASDLLGKNIICIFTPATFVVSAARKKFRPYGRLLPNKNGRLLIFLKNI